MRTVTQKWALVGPGFQQNFDTKAQIMLFMAKQWFLDQFPEGYEFAIVPVYVIVEAEPPMLEYYK